MTSSFDDKQNLALSTIGNKGYLVLKVNILNEKYQKLNKLYDKCKKISLTVEEHAELVMLDAYHSATIEGARTTIEKVKKSVASAKKGKSERMVLNSIAGLKFALSNELSVRNLIETWKIVSEDVCENTGAGADGFRTKMVYVASDTRVVHIPQEPEAIESSMQRLIDVVKANHFNGFFTAAIFHLYFAYIHPFCDCNGRVARIYSAVAAVQCGLDLFKDLPVSQAINQQLSGYYNSLEDSETIQDNEMDITPFVSYMFDVYAVAMQQYILLAEPLSEAESRVISAMSKTGKGIISISKAAKMLSMTEQEALIIINSLNQKGYLAMYGPGEYILGWRDK